MPREHRFDSRDARTKLKARGEPYWRQIVPGLFLGLRKGKRASTWIARQRAPGGGYVEQRVGIADDHAEADGSVVLSYGEAVKLATTTQVEARSAAPKHYGDGPTLNKIVDAYLESRSTTPGGRQSRVMGENSAKVTRQAWDRYGRAGIGRKLVTALNAKALKEWHVGVSREPPHKRGKEMPFDPRDPEQVRARRSSANRILTILKAALNWARHSEELPDSLPDYWTRVQPFSLGEDPPPRMLEASEVTRLLNAAAPDLRDLLTGALMTGARYGDLTVLKVSDFVAEQGVVRLAQSKTGKLLWQPLTPEGAKFFKRITAGRSADELIFVRTDGRPWSKSDAARPMAAAVEAAKLEDVTFKTTRATYGKLLLLATLDLELVARALGHSDSRITRKHYAQYLPNEVAAGIAKLPELGIHVDGKVTRIRKKTAA